MNVYVYAYNTTFKPKNPHSKQRQMDFRIEFDN